MTALFCIGAVEMSLSLFTTMVHKGGNQPPFHEYNARAFLLERSEVPSIDSIIEIVHWH